ncbi:MAG: EI24 domain-containing protein [Lishizhenia sp.]
MKFLKHFALGLSSYWAALKFIFKERLYWYFPIPAALMLGIYFAGNKIVAWKSTWDDQIGCATCVNMNATIWFVLKLLISISVGLILMKFAKYIVVVLLSPLITHLSQKVEMTITGNTYPFSLAQTLHDVKRGLRIALRNIMWEYFFFLILLIVSFFGWDKPENSPIFYLTFAIAFFYYGFSFLDYINERRRLDIDQSIFFVRNHRGLAIAIGMVFSLLILVPVDIGQMFDYSNFSKAPWETLGNSGLNVLLWIMASSAPILAIVAATLAMHKLVDLNENKYSVKVPESEQSTEITENDPQ